MIGLDTNVLVRYIMQDDPKQSIMATQLIESLDVDGPGFVTLWWTARIKCSEHCVFLKTAKQTLQIA